MARPLWLLAAVNNLLDLWVLSTDVFIVFRKFQFPLDYSDDGDDCRNENDH